MLLNYCRINNGLLAKRKYVFIVTGFGTVCIDLVCYAF